MKLKVGLCVVVLSMCCGFTQDRSKCSIKEMQQIDLFKCNPNTGYCIHKKNPKCKAEMAY